jgi:beta propeller repeat protein
MFLSKERILTTEAPSTQRSNLCLAGKISPEKVFFLIYCSSPTEMKVTSEYGILDELENPNAVSTRLSVVSRQWSFTKHWTRSTRNCEMKISNFITGIAILAALLCVGGLAFAKQLTVNTYEDAFPHIKGDRVVWQGRAGGSWEVFLYEMDKGGSPIQLTGNTYDDLAPQTDGTYVVWVGYSRQGGEIFFFAPGQGVLQLTDDDKLDSSPQIAGGKIVWESHPVAASVEPGDIFLYDILAGVVSCLSCASDGQSTSDDRFPWIDGQFVYWARVKDTGETVLMTVELPNGLAQEGSGYLWPDSRETDGNLTVLTKHDGHDSELFMRYADVNKVQQITENDYEDRFPAVSGKNVVWVGGEGNSSEIFLWEGRSDFDSDLDVDLSDLSFIAGDFGRTGCEGGSRCEGDFDGDGDVDGLGLAEFAEDLKKGACLRCP